MTCPKMPCLHVSELRAKTLLVLLPHHFEIVGLLFLTLGFSLRARFLLGLQSIGNGYFCFCVDSLGVNDELQAIGKRRTDKIDGILCILPRRHGLVPHFIVVVRRGIDLRHSTSRRAVLRRNGVHHVLRSESFPGGSTVSHGNLVELGVVKGKENLFDGIRSERSPRKVRRPPSQFLDQRWTAVKHLYIGYFLTSTIQHSGQAHSKGKVPILGKILSM